MVVVVVVVFGRPPFGYPPNNRNGQVCVKSQTNSVTGLAKIRRALVAAILTEQIVLVGLVVAVNVAVAAILFVYAAAISAPNVNESGNHIRLAYVCSYQLAIPEAERRATLRCAKLNRLIRGIVAVFGAVAQRVQRNAFAGFAVELVTGTVALDLLVHIW